MWTRHVACGRVVTGRVVAVATSRAVVERGGRRTRSVHGTMDRSPLRSAVHILDAFTTAEAPPVVVRTGVVAVYDGAPKPAGREVV